MGNSVGFFNDIATSSPIVHGFFDGIRIARIEVLNVNGTEERVLFFAGDWRMVLCGRGDVSLENEEGVGQMTRLRLCGNDLSSITM